MAATVIHSTDVFDINPLPNPQMLNPGIRASNPGEFVTRFHPKVGHVKFKSLMFSHMHVMNLHWASDSDLVAYESSPTNTVNINFHMAGRQDTTFEGIQCELNMAPGRHNLVYSPGGGYINRIHAHEPAEMFHISLDKMYFADIIGCDDRWSEKMQDNLLNDRPFSGIKGTLDLTPLMQRVIMEIKQCREVGTMRNLLVQSKVLELLALQIDQFRGSMRVVSGISVADMDKLYQLKYFLDNHFLEEHSLSELSRMCLLNEFKVKKGFKELFGTTVFGYLRELRMNYAERLLLDSSHSVEEVSEILGYEHAQHFSIAFKKYRGTNPSKIKAGKIST
ncbi:AraC family transcriptional regulator [Dyadobacter sp. CY261]|uniref:helix-turn-helix transcriptional regulator n=1 Tax=Dyadobacter sp. CY261 TaxID=2907203 RepID=UPI001F3E7F1A|nr:AraC family transcriptional regulator [Dyadobacter sp. CY261]MCF0070067.1 AraC family transcriptional regulator [Dyadobacter sp. CY261]